MILVSNNEKKIYVKLIDLRIKKSNKKYFFSILKFSFFWHFFEAMNSSIKKYNFQF